MIEVRTDSVIREAGGVIFKQHRDDGATRARREFETLTMLREAMPGTYTVPRAIQFDAANSAVVMERASGTPLDETIAATKRESDAVAHLTEPLRRAGEWLRAMQTATMWSAATPVAAVDPERQLALPHSTPRDILSAQIVKAIHDAETIDADAEVIARLRELQVRVAPRATVACGHHGDYWPGNVFLDETRVTVIDFEGYRHGLPLEDVAYFLIELELLLPRHARYLPALRVAFLEGYGAVEDADALTLFTLTKTLHLMARNPGAQHSLLIRLWMRRTLRKIVQRCLPR
jgi:Ser/Thr protein kinase RdoA (MazF antagonist)